MSNDHIPVLLKESIDGLELHPDSVFVDCTLGGGGHTREVCERFGPNVKIIAIDADSDAISDAKNSLPRGCDITFVKDNFRNIKRIFSELKINEADAILLDLGLSSNQLTKSGRGFSFKNDEPLIMTLRDDFRSSEITAMDVVNTWDKDELERIFREYGEESFSRVIAEKIVETRRIKPIRTTAELVEVVGSAIPKKFQHGRIHFATKVFQALRIAVNDEIGALVEILVEGFSLLRTGGKMAVISFHSLEDREVKVFFRNLSLEGRGELLSKKPIVPSRAEVLANPRSRSAKLRIVKKIS